MPLLPSMATEPYGGLPLGLLPGLTRLVVAFEHRHPGGERQLAAAGLGQLTRLRHLAIDWEQVGRGGRAGAVGTRMSSQATELSADIREDDVESEGGAGHCKMCLAADRAAGGAQVT